MPPRPGTRRAQPSTGSLGRQFDSPKRPRNKQYTRRLVKIPGQAARHQAHIERLDQLLGRTNGSVPQSPVVRSTDSLETVQEESYEFSVGDDAPSCDMVIEEEDHLKAASEVISIPSKPHTRRILPDQTAERLYCNWRALLPMLVQPYLEYSTRTLGKALETLPAIMSRCKHIPCERKSNQVLCLLFDLASCKCATLPQILLYFGLFPTSPSQPNMAVSVDLLAFYRSLFERSCDAINALASALHTHYTRRGFHITNKSGQPVLDPFRRSLGNAVQWYDVLLVEVERQIENAVQNCRNRLKASSGTLQIESSPPANVIPNLVPENDLPSPILLQCCPACFGGTKFGTPLKEGGDIHVATDGNFHHRHRRSAGDSPPFYDPSYFLSKEQVDAMGDHIAKARKKPIKSYQQIVPDEAIDECETSYEAADGHKEKAATEAFDDTGLMVLICRHDIPLFFANIDTPGEQQKFPLALIQHLITLLPSKATVVILYDIGCVLSRTLRKYDILPSETVERLRFATTAMHAYGHEWACQLVFNPRLAVGLGLSDGEGVERLWSRLLRLIGIQRGSSRKRRIWMIDRQAAAVGKEMKSDLGDWIKRRLRRGVHEQGEAARRQVDESGYDVEALRAQWTSQKACQLTVRAHAPKRLKKQLDMVISLQSELDAASKVLETARSTIEKDKHCSQALDVLSELEDAKDNLMSKVDGLYTSLNVQDTFPELKEVSFDFVRILLLACDLKINIRKRAIGSFFEWDRLDRAVGGSQKPLGTKLHQQTRKAISKRQPALMSAIRKFNGYCMQLELLHNPEWMIPLPHSLPTKLAELRDTQTLMEDVWITPSVGTVPLWMEDKSVRFGIRGLLKSDRCVEEEKRLRNEAENLCRWYGDELGATELALLTPTNSMFSLLLEQRRTHLLSLPGRWANPFVSHSQFEIRQKEAVSLAGALADVASHMYVIWDRPSGSTIEAADPILAEEEIPIASDVDLEEDINVALADYLAEEPCAGPEQDDDPATAFKILWELPPVITERMSAENGLSLVRETCDTQNESPRLSFNAEDIQILATPTACLNDICINGCITLLFQHIQPINPDRFGLFSTYDIYHIRHNASDDTLWRTMKHTSFWTKNIWIIPIHRPGIVGHWVLCVVNISRQEILLFDSMAERQPWRANVQEVMSLISRLRSVAIQYSVKFNPEMRFEWIARPVELQPMQTNGYDCGVWVLAVIAAVLRGFDMTGLREKDIQSFRSYLHSMVICQ
ncbi:hypothetical protein EV363DRAFT_1177524 [Boletus edulis]|nr:hypothetical protein EV363DRAFT_1177524 [Boletus edulis]